MAVLAAYGVEKSEQQVASALGKLTKLSWYVCNPLILLPAAVYRCVPGIDGELPLTNMLSYRITMPVDPSQKQFETPRIQPVQGSGHSTLNAAAHSANFSKEKKRDQNPAGSL
ncbi:uncharacterized protein SEPMUDRAFT_124302, partial [Sphaerulina musiva SO2202]